MAPPPPPDPHPVVNPQTVARHDMSNVYDSTKICVVCVHRLSWHFTQHFSTNEIRNDSMKMDYCVKCVILLVGIVGAVESLGELYTNNVKK